MRGLHMSSHYVHLVERFGAVGTFSHAVRNTIVNTMVAEKMTTGLQNGILEIFSTNSAQRKSLYLSV